MALYRDYDRAGLDAQYYLRGVVKDFQAYFDLWDAGSARARETMPCRLDVAYGPSGPERLDIFPAVAGAPVHVFIHGGYWQSLDKRNHDFVAAGLVPHGAATVVLNYALAPTVSMDEIVRQNRAALAWVWRHARDFGADPGRIFVSGHSAGGHLTAMMLGTDWPAFAPDLPPDLIKGGTAISGIYDLEPVRLCYLNDKVQLDGASAARNSPIRHLPDRAPPLQLTVGALETPEFLRQQADFASACRAKGLAVEVLPAPGLHHFSIVAELEHPDSPLTRAICRQMGLPS